jgi:uncharacterized alkaline shock family protein YloU
VSPAERAPERGADPAVLAQPTEPAAASHPPTADGGTSEGDSAAELAQRGLTEIADRVVARLAARLAAEVDGVVPDEPVGGLRGALPGLRGGSRIDANADVGRRTARVNLSIDVRYPQAAAEVSDRVRDRVIEGVRRLTGLEVDWLALTVRRLVVGVPGRRRVA